MQASNENAPGPTRASTHQSTNTAIVAEPTETGNFDKLKATMKARFARAGHQVFDGPDNSFIVALWGYARECRDLSSLMAFAKQIGVR